MQFGDVHIPDRVLEAAFLGDLVIFAGAGVSVPSPVNLPRFNDLVNQIKSAVDPGGFLRERKSKSDKNEDAIYVETPEQYLSYLEHKGKDVKKACSSLIDPHGKYSDLHASIIKTLDANGHIRLVTTNFDNCFENALEALGCKCKIYSSPALPLGKNVDGLVHLHGVGDDLDSMVLTAEDYGSAYVSDGWASRFLVDLFKTYTILFVGYSCGDSLVDYLTRSVSSEISGHSFVLCQDPDADDWRMRGVEPIVFDDFDILPKIFNDWSSYSKLSVTARVGRIHDICRADNISPADEGFIIQTLRWPNEDDRRLFTSEFCKVASKIEHFQLLKNNGFIDFLSSKKPEGQELLLLEWVVETFSVSETATLQDLCADYIYELTPIFFEKLFWKLAASDIPENVIASWLPWLEFSDYSSQKRCEYQLIKIAYKLQSDSIAYVAIRILLKVGITYSYSILTGTVIKPSIVVSQEYYGDKLVEIIKARSSIIKKQIFEYCFDQIERAYCIQTKCWTEKDAFDGISFSRSSIAPHDQNRFCGGVEGVLVNITRECITQSNHLEAQDKCLSSNCALLFRIGLWIKAKYNLSGSDLNFVIEKDLLSNIYIHHETFLLIKSAFPIASDNERRKFVEYIASRVAVGDRDSEYSCFNVCVWLMEEMDTCPDLLALYDEIAQRNPDFLPREHPEFTHYMSSGFVDNSDECRLAIEDFNNDYLLELIQSPAPLGSFITKYNRVSTPTHDYPLIAIQNLYSLLDKECSEDEIELMNLYIQSIKWGNPDVLNNDLVSLLERIVADERTCVAGIEAIKNSTIDTGDPLNLSCEALISILEKALPNFDKLFTSQSSIIKSDGSDWLLMGINHPAGKYVEFLATANRMFYKEHKSHSQRISICLEGVSERLSEESVAAKCVIACIYSRINELQGLNPDCFKKKLLYALQPEPGNWAFSSAWEGLSYVGKLTPEAWRATRKLWPGLFKNYRSVAKNQFEQLVGMYVLNILVLGEPEERSRYFISGASASKDALKSACMQIDYWMGKLSEEDRLREWDIWLTGLFEKLATVAEWASDVLAELYSRWVREYPEMRSRLITAILKDCKNAQDADLFVFDGTLLNIAEDARLSHTEKVNLIAFLLKHQKYLHFESDVKGAIQLIEQEHTDDDDMQELRDIVTRKGMISILSTNSA